MKIDEDDLEFVAWYREYFGNETELPCLKCSDEKIIACSYSTTKTGCERFLKYLRLPTKGAGWSI